MTENRADVIIIGAGIAGLTAADALSKAGLRVIILEARDRIGGRIFTQLDPECGFPIELGAEFIHGRPPILLDRIQRERLSVREIKGEPWCREFDADKHSRLVPCGDFWKQTEHILSEMNYNKSRDRSFARFLNSPKLRRFDPHEKSHATNYVEGFNAARAHDVSVNWLVRSMRAEEEIDGDRQFRIVGGYGVLVEAIGKRIVGAGVRIETKTVVSRIRWSKAKVAIAARRNGSGISYSAPRVLVTLPLGVLQAAKKQLGAVEFRPALPEKKRALTKLKMGEVVRVDLRFANRFWERIRPSGSGKSLSKMTFLFSHEDVFPTWWTAFPETAPLISAWSPSWHAEELIGRPHSYIAWRALAKLAGAFSTTTEHLQEMLKEAYAQDWQADPFARGAYSYVMVGGERAAEVLAKPVAGTLFFAGEATATDGHNGTVHGAITTAERAVKEVLKTVRA